MAKIIILGDDPITRKALCWINVDSDEYKISYNGGSPSYIEVSKGSHEVYITTESYLSRNTRSSVNDGSFLGSFASAATTSQNDYKAYDIVFEDDTVLLIYIEQKISSASIHAKLTTSEDVEEALDEIKKTVAAQQASKATFRSAVAWFILSLIPVVGLFVGIFQIARKKKRIALGIVCIITCIMVTFTNVSLFRFIPSIDFTGKFGGYKETFSSSQVSSSQVSSSQNSLSQNTSSQNETVSESNSSEDVKYEEINGHKFNPEEYEVFYGEKNGSFCLYTQPKDGEIIEFLPECVEIHSFFRDPSGNTDMYYVEAGGIRGWANPSWTSAKPSDEDLDIANSIIASNNLIKSYVGKTVEGRTNLNEDEVLDYFHNSQNVFWNTKCSFIDAICDLSNFDYSSLPNEGRLTENLSYAPKNKYNSLREICDYYFSVFSDKTAQKLLLGNICEYKGDLYAMPHGMGGPYSTDTFTVEKVDDTKYKVIQHSVYPEEYNLEDSITEHFCFIEDGIWVWD